ncbi:threonine-phosphate decarboxylase CobD [Marinobacter litoralis]|uniref:threonine-phosphate decarboxylase CobD n=1 Tax=Marinobacter litoralis TaxID=187981 RepID=UPI002A0A470E|nr:threonine-phosphate decarboxylase CobD [Marinobacter litoralis]
MIPFHSPESPEHGGRLEAAVRKWGIPRDQWLDLSTGINPVPYPIPEIPMEVWQRLPEPDDGLEDIIRHWAGAPAEAACLPVAGSQQAIMALPVVRKHLHGVGRVAVPMPGYREHGHAWQRAGFDVVGISAQQALADDLSWLDTVDVVVWINPNNPTGQVLSPERLMAWRQRLARRGGWLVVDEAFVEGLPGHMLDPWAGAANLIILRSLGKFFGLAGIRAGAALLERELAKHVNHELGPWPVSGPARYLMKRVLQDENWQAEALIKQKEASARLSALLEQHGLGHPSGALLFQTVRHPQAAEIADSLARCGILVRCFDTPEALRFGLPANEAGWTRLTAALSGIHICH